MATAMSSPTAYGSYLATTHASALIKQISELTGQLQRDLELAERKRLLCEVRDIRRALRTLEYELLEETHDVRGDAC